VQAQPPHSPVWSIGLRAGKDPGFRHVDYFDLWGAWSPARLRIPTGVELDAGLELGGAMMVNHQHRVGLVHAGFLFRLSFDFGLFFALGFSPAILASRDIGDYDLGLPLVFITGLEVGFRLFNHVAFSARIQHASNGYLGEKNPGIENVNLGITLLF
jgi:hypothetical protein